MDRRILAAAGIALLVVAGVAGAAALGAGPFTHHTANGSSTGGDTTTATDDGASGGASENATDDTTPDVGPFQFTVRNVTECGTTCRDVTVSLTNTANESASDVSAHVALTTHGDRVWETTRDVGTLHADETTVQTLHIELGYLDAAKVQNNDGDVTVHTTINSSLGTYTFQRQRNVT